METPYEALLKKLDAFWAVFADLQNMVAALFPAGSLVVIDAGNAEIYGVVHGVCEFPTDIGVVLQHGDIRYFTLRRVQPWPEGKSVPEWLARMMKEKKWTSAV